MFWKYNIVSSDGVVEIPDNAKIIGVLPGCGDGEEADWIAYLEPMIDRVKPSADPMLLEMVSVLVNPNVKSIAVLDNRVSAIIRFLEDNHYHKDVVSRESKK
jgi:hypothetical protein